MFKQFYQKIKNIRQPKAAILMYHQVCQRKNDPWELAVHPDHFHDQLDYLKKNFTVVPIGELATSMSNNTIQPRTIAITFDDGFKDNYISAAPMLDYYDLPATFYVATTAMKDRKIYWWEELQDILFQSEVLPRDFEMNIQGEVLSHTFKSDRALDKRLMNQIHAWNYHLPIPNERIAFYMMLWRRIKPLAYHHQNTIINEIKSWAGAGVTSGQAQTMDIREMQMLSQNPLFSIGAHSVHHAMLAEQNVNDQAFEVRESKRQIETWLGKPVKGFAYPYGNYNAVTQTLLREAGFEYAVSTEQKLVTAKDDRFALPRIQIKNWCVYEFASKMNEMVN